MITNSYSITINKQQDKKDQDNNSNIYQNPNVIKTTNSEFQSIKNIVIKENGSKVIKTTSIIKP